VVVVGRHQGNMIWPFAASGFDRSAGVEPADLQSLSDFIPNAMRPHQERYFVQEMV
jgi:hypothetical protein